MTEDPSFTERHDDLALRRLYRDTETHVERLALSLASNDPSFVRLWAEQIIPVYRRRKVPMGDLIRLTEALGQAANAVLAPGERGPIDEATAEAVQAFRRQRRIPGDGRRRNRILEFIYKGA